MCNLIAICTNVKMIFSSEALQALEKLVTQQQRQQVARRQRMSSGCPSGSMESA